MMSQDTKGIGYAINEETLSYSIQSMVDNTLKTWRRRSTLHSGKPTPADQDFAVGDLQAKVYQAIHAEGSKWAPPNRHAGQPATAGQPAASSNAAEKYETYTSSSGSGAHGTGF
eukprot:6383180-Pyramimonas_sp.AAC.2